MTLPENRALCVQMMLECAAAVRETKLGTPQNLNMKIKLALLRLHANDNGWLPECFDLDDDLKLPWFYKHLLDLN